MHSYYPEDLLAHAVNRYKADLRDMRFLMFEQFNLQDLLGKAPFGDWDQENIEMVISEIYKFATSVLGPLNQIGDEHGCKVVDGSVITPEGFKDAWAKLYEAGWRTVAVSPEFGGMGSPATIGILTDELLSGANTAFNMYPGLAMGAAEVVGHFGSDRQKKLFVQRMLDGRWGGTMCLTEPHAGSDVGASTTTAKKNEDGTYSIKGTKIYISGGDHDLSFDDNIVHLVLARIDGAVAGTKGLSLFIVPKRRVDDDGKNLRDNDVRVVSIEHKMGINGSATCVLSFGEDDECLGELIGEVEHHGMRQMFKMMNFARIGVGIQGLAVASSAYLNALEYARDRKQGSSVKDWKDPSAPRVPIIEHPNIRKDLLEMKAKVEGIRALIVKLSTHQDRETALAGKDDASAAYHKGQINLLTPLVKAYSSDEGFEICAKAIQVYGGAGYLRDHPVEQYCRDAKIFSIYEGTNAIQSLDLVGRKLGQAGGANTQAFLGDIQKFISANKDHELFADAIKQLQKAHEAVGGTVMLFLGWFQSGFMDRIPLVSERFLKMMSELAIGWLLLEQAVLAKEKLADVSDTHPDHAFYTGKIHGAIYFAKNILPTVVGTAKVISLADTSPNEIPDAAFGI